MSAVAESVNNIPKEEVMEVDLNVSCSEESKGGIKYEVLIGEQKVVTPLRTPSTTCGARPLSAEVIQLKIEKATERRKSLEALRLASLSKRFSRIEEAAKKREDFSIAVKENLEQKIEASTANRETLISDLKTKLSTHNTGHLQEVRQNQIASLTEFEEKVKVELESKLEMAEKNREKVLQEKLESLKKHDEKVEMIRNKRNSTMDLCDGEADANEEADMENVIVVDTSTSN